MTFAQALEHAIAQYQKLLNDHKSSMTKETLALVERNAAKPRPTGRRITIERERERVVLMSQCPYVGAQPVNRRII